MCEQYTKLGFDFVLQVCNSPGYLEQLTGLDVLRKQTESVDCDWDEEDDEDGDAIAAEQPKDE